jgi:glycosyltransferase involved in cell wall biosynthesis
VVSPLISVVLPVYNGACYLRESVDSVLAQGFSEFELIVCDDGSTDDSRAIIRSYSDPRLRLRSHLRNEGLFPTLNQLLSEARAPLVRLWAQDDRMKPGCLAKEWEFWKAHPEIGMSYCARDTIDEHGSCIGKAPVDATPTIVEPWLADQISYYWGSMPGNIATVMLRKAVFEEVGPFAAMQVSADFDLWTRITERFPIGFLREPLIDLRSHKEQLSRKSGAFLSFIREDRQIYKRLARRLPHPVQKHGRYYHLRHRTVQYLHGCLRTLAAGKLRLAWEMFAEVCREGNPVLVLFLWLATGNGRWCRPRPLYHMPSIVNR